MVVEPQGETGDASHMCGHRVEREQLRSERLRGLGQCRHVRPLRRLAFLTAPLDEEDEDVEARRAVQPEKGLTRKCCEPLELVRRGQVRGAGERLYEREEGVPCHRGA